MLPSVILAWSLASPARAITITEIHYNPGGSGSPDENLEFVEIYNDSPVPYDLSGCYFSKGIEFTFPDGTFLKARQALAVCADAALMKTRFPTANLIGDFAGRLDNGGEEIVIVTPAGSPLAKVTYQDRGRWPTTPDGTGYSLSLKNVFADVSDPDNWTRSGLPGGTPGTENFPPPTVVDHEIFPESTPWRYRKGWNEATSTPEDFSTPSGAWRGPAFDDAAWPEGPAPIGFGEPEIATTLADMDGKYISFAVRRKFQITQEQANELVSLELTVRVDDGVVAYLNGQEIGRLGVPGDAGTDVPYDAAATSTRELKSTKPIVFTIPKEKAHAGENVIALQVHNRVLTGAGSDAGVVAALAYQTIYVAASPPVTTVVINEVISRAPAAARAVEVYNTLAQSVDLSGYVLSPDPQRLRSFTVPAGTQLPAHGFASFTEATLGFGLAAQDLSVFLFAADGQSILDAVTVEDPVILPQGNQSHARYPDGKAAWWISTTPTPGAANSIQVEKDLVINEINFDPKLVLADGSPDPAPERGEWIEVYNRSNHAISLDGFSMASGFNYAFATGSTIEAGGYLVVARDPKFVRETYGLPAAQVVGPAEGATPDELDTFGTLKNSGERIRIADPLGNTVDEVRYGPDGEWDGKADGGGSTLELIDPMQDNASPLAWGASDETKGAPWTEVSYESKHVMNLPPAPTESELHIFLISEGECLIDGVSLTQGDPPVELIPNGGFETDTKPWRLAGTHVQSVRTTDEAKEGGACLHMIASGSGDNRVNRIELDTTPVLKAGPVKFHMWARWLSGSSAIHVSGYNNAFGKTVYLSIPSKLGTPGRENSLRARLRAETGSDNLGPVISKVSHSPAVPGANETITFRATVTDSDGVASVDVLHQKDNSPDFTRAPLFDDGAHDDGDAGDGVYAGEVPGYPLKTLVNFMIEAKDMGGRTRLYPRDAPDNSRLFIVDDKIESTVSRYRLLVNNKNLNTPVTGLARRLLHSDELVHGTFIFEESEVYYDVGLRYHGSPWNRPPEPKMFRIRFNGDKPFLDGAKRINISRYGTAQNEGLAYQILTRAGTADSRCPSAPRYTYTTMRLNGNPHGSVVAEIRPIDSNYAQFNWPSDSEGYAWKITGKLAFTDGGQMAGGGPDWTQFKVYSGATSPYPGVESPENVRFYYNPDLKNDEDVFDPLLRLLHAMDKSTTPDAGYDQAIADILNVESSMRVFAVRSLLADWDTIDIGNGQNGYIYYAPIEGKCYLVPWDMDHTFERADVAIAPGAGTTGFRRLINRPVYKRLYARLLNELNNSSWSNAYVTAWTNMVSETGTPAHVGGGSGLVSFLNGRRNMVNTFIKTGTVALFAVSTPNPSGFPGGKAQITGTANLDAAHLFAGLNGADPVEVNAIWSTPPKQPTAIPTLWQIEVTGLVPGKNVVEVLGFSSGGEVVGTGKVDVYDSTGWEAPAVSSVEPASGPLAGGTSVTLHGSGFRSDARVDVGGKPATEVVVVSAGEITAKTPEGAAPGAVEVGVTNIDGQRGALAGGFQYGSAVFQRGEVDGTAGINLTDALAILNYLFRGNAINCLDAADVDDTGHIDLTDAVYLLRYLFQGGTQPPEPFDAAGDDATADDLDCGS